MRHDPRLLGPIPPSLPLLDEIVLLLILLGFFVLSLLGVWKAVELVMAII